MKVITAPDLDSPARVHAPQQPRIGVGLVQTRWHEDREEHLSVLQDGVTSAAAAGAKIVFLPELTLSRYFADIRPEADAATQAEVLEGGPTHRAAARFAAVAGVHVQASLFERAPGPDGLGLNTAIVVGPDGAIVQRTRKMHIPRTAGYYENSYFREGDPGDGYPVGELELDGTSLRFGVPTCFDQWFPEVSREYSLGGAQLVAYPTAIGSEPDHPDFDTLPGWRTAILGQAIASGVFVVVPNRYGHEGNVTFYGSSFIADPYGRVLAEAPRDADAVVVAHLDLAQRQDWLDLFPFLLARRPDSYRRHHAAVEVDQPYGGNPTQRRSSFA